MPIQQSVSVCQINEGQPRPRNSLTKNEALLLLRQREVLAYHHICEVFRAQGDLTPEKLKLLKEIAAALYIPDVRHHAECRMAISNRELNAIAECVAGPGTDVEWRKESIDTMPAMKPGRINAMSLRLADAVAEALQAHMQQMGDIDEHTVVTKTIRLKSSLFERDFKEPVNVKKSEVGKPHTSTNGTSGETAKEVAEDDAKDDDSCSSVSSASDDSLPKEEEETKPEVKKLSKEEMDATLMPPPPPVIFIPPPTLPPAAPPTASPLPPSPPVITVPPPSSLAVVGSAPTTVPVPVTSLEVPQMIDAPIDDTLLSEAEEAQARADFFSSLPPLVVVPPPDPSETSVLHSPSLHSPSLVLSPGMSIQIRDDTKKRKRTLSQSQDASAGAVVSAAKTVALSSYSKVTPVMVSAASASSQAQVKVTPIISRAKMATTSQAQKVIIVSNTPTSNTPILQRSLNVPMTSVGLPIIRGNQPRFHPVTARGTNSGAIRPKMVTVPARCRAKGSSMVNLQLKNAITLNQDNVTVVDTSAKRQPGPTKILPKPSGSMFIVSTGPGSHKLATTVGGGREGGKQNVVIVQKGHNQRTLTLSNTNKELMQKLMSKKCVVIQSSKMVPKTMSPKAPPPSSQQKSPVLSSAGNTVVLDLSQEQYRQNLGGTTVREILQAAGIITQPVTAQNSTLSEAAQMSSAEGEWLPVETTKSLSLEEVSLPIGQSESFVTLDEAVEMLEDQHIDGGLSVGEDGFTSTGSEQAFTLTSDQLSSGNLTVVADKPEQSAGQVVIKTLPSEVASDSDCMSQGLLPHKDGAVAIQHSNIDVPANMSLEDYSSQQMENENFN